MHGTLRTLGKCHTAPYIGVAYYVVLVAWLLFGTQYIGGYGAFGIFSPMFTDFHAIFISFCLLWILDSDDGESHDHYKGGGMMGNHMTTTRGGGDDGESHDHYKGGGMMGNHMTTARAGDFVRDNFVGKISPFRVVTKFSSRNCAIWGTSCSLCILRGGGSRVLLRCCRQSACLPHLFIKSQLHW